MKSRYLFESLSFCVHRGKCEYHNLNQDASGNTADVNLRLVAVLNVILCRALLVECASALWQ